MKIEIKPEPRVFSARKLSELDSLILTSTEKLTFVAGATDLLARQAEMPHPAALVDLSSVAELTDTIEVQDHGLQLGGAVPLSKINNHPVIQSQFPILVEACRQIGSVQIQNRATLGGNIANASPAGDSLPVLSVLDAEICIGPRESGQFQKFKLAQVMLGPGQTSLNNNRYIAFIYLPFYPPENSFWAFRKVGQRQALAISKVSLAVLGWLENGRIKEIRISAGSVSPQITRAQRTENLLRGQLLSEARIEAAGEMLKSEVDPIDDIRSTKNYRQHISGELLKEILFQAEIKYAAL